MVRRSATGRYCRQAHVGATMPGNGLAIPPKSKNITTICAAVVDPMEPSKRLLVSVNRHVDTLEDEFAHGRLSEGGYAVGRELQRVFERSATIGAGSQWQQGDRVDAEQAKERAIHSKIDLARDIDAEMRRLIGEVGELGARFLREILTGTSFASYANAGLQREPSRREVAMVAGRFRKMLEEIVEARQGQGPATRRPVDKHDLAARRLPRAS